MRPRKSFPPDTAKRLEKLLATSNSDAERSRIQCVWLRAKYGYSVEQIAKEIGFEIQTVRNIHSLFLKNGEASLTRSGKSGRKNFHLDLKSETTFLAGFEKEAKLEGIKVSKIHSAYQKMVGKKVALTTIYRMLHRHGWRRFAYSPGFWYPPEENK